MDSLTVVGTVAGRAWLALMVAVIAAPAALAQQAPQRPEVRAFRDSVLGSRDTSQLRVAESSLMLEARRDRSNAMLHLRLGVIAERFGAWRDAAAEYKWATDLEPRWSDAWLGWALSELRIGDEVETASTNRRLRLARDAWARSAQAIARAVDLDPSVLDRVVKEVAAAVAAGRVDWARVLRDGVAKPAGRRGADGAVLLAMGVADRMLGDTAGAVRAFDAAAGTPGFLGRGLLERARTQLTAGDDRGIAAYFAGAESEDSVAILGYRQDLELIGSEAELARYDAVDPVDRPAFLWDLWTDRDRADLRRNGERLTEHYRRIAVARGQYGDLGDLRAQVLIRHGEPDGRASLRHPQLLPNESWWYRPADRPFVVHFVARADSNRYELVESLFDIGESDGLGRVPGGGESTQAATIDPELLLRSRAQLAPFYQAAVDADAGVVPDFRQRERQLGAAGRVAGLSEDGYPIRFARALAVRVQLAGLVNGSAGSGIHLFFAMPGFAAEPQGGNGLALYPTRLRVVVRDSIGAVVRAIDTVVVVERETPAASAERIGAGLAVPLPAGRYRVRAAIQSGSTGTFVERAIVDVPSLRPDRLVLSDLLLAGRRSQAPIQVRLGEAELPVDPAPMVGRADTLTLRGEILGGHGERGRLRVLVRPLRGESDKAERWRPFPGFSDWIAIELPVPGALRAVELSLPVRRLSPGAYELQVVAIDGSGVTAWQQAAFEVEDRSR